MDLLQSYKALKNAKKNSRYKYIYEMNNLKTKNFSKNMFVARLKLKVAQTDISNKMNNLKPRLAREFNKIEFLIN